MHGPGVRSPLACGSSLIHPGVGSASLPIDISDTLGQPLSVERLMIEANRTHPGMRPVFVDTEELESGRYLGRISLSMPGDWFLLVSGRLPDGTRFMEEFRFSVVQPSRHECVLGVQIG